MNYNPVVLTDHQTDKKVDLFTLLNQGHLRIIVCGSAGCGKTTLVTDIVKDLLSDGSFTNRYNNGMVYVTAPTNKALSILQGKIHLPVEFKTIHSALKLKRTIDRKTGAEKYIRSDSKAYKHKDEFTHCRVCVLDECSMINQELLDYLKDYKFPIIFVGDEKQLNPVNEDNSPVFYQGWPQVELTEIIRQGAGNPIIELSRDLDLIYFKTPKIIDGKGYLYNNNRGNIIDNLAEVNGTDELKYLSWTNKDVDEMNWLVRQRRYGEKPRRVERWETIVFNSPFGTFYTNKEVKIEDLEVYVDTIKVPRYDTRFDKDNQPITATDEVKMKFYKLNGSIDIVHEDSDNIFLTVVNNLASYCKNRGWDWRGFYWFKEQFADIKYNHSISVHKSQGSTYKQTIINIGNIDFNKNIKEKKRLLYTAVTRASDLLILNNVR